MNKTGNGESREAMRMRMRRMRAQLSETEQMKAQDGAAARIMSLEAYAHARTVMAYIAARGELSLCRVIDDVLLSGRRLVLPRCEAAGVMTPRIVERLDQLEPGAYGLMEPSRACPVIAPEDIDLVLAPGTAFDRAGNRLGQGGGYYDRFLPATKAVRVGVCHGFALHEAIGAQAHDERMDFVVTPDGIYASGRKKN